MQGVRSPGVLYDVMLTKCSRRIEKLLSRLHESSIARPTESGQFTRGYRGFKIDDVGICCSASHRLSRAVSLLAPGVAK